MGKCKKAPKPYEGYWVLGPYSRKDGRQHVILRMGKKLKTVSYPKYLVEIRRGKFLQRGESVHHKDHKPLNNLSSNLFIMPHNTHVALDAIRVRKKKVKCVWCNKCFYREPRQLHRNSNLKKAGPFCSKQCTGKYGAYVQNKNIEKLPPQPSVPIKDRHYYRKALAQVR